MRRQSVRIALPSVSSKLYGVALSATFPEIASDNTFKNSRLLRYVESGSDIVFCRGRDIPRIVDSGAADMGVTGYDVIVEYMLRSNRALVIKLLEHRRRSFVALVSSSDQAVTRIYSEYPAITHRWTQATMMYSSVEVIPVSGSSEGIISCSPTLAGILLVTTGDTLRANGLHVKCPLLWTDLCVVARKATENESMAIWKSVIGFTAKLGAASFCGRRVGGSRRRPERWREPGTPRRWNAIPAEADAMIVTACSEEEAGRADVEEKPWVPPVDRIRGRWCRGGVGSSAGHFAAPGPGRSMFAFLAVHRAEVFPDAGYADLFAPRGRGRPSIPATQMAAVMTLQVLCDYSDRETAEAVRFDVRWKVAIGAPLDDPGFDPSSLVYWRRRLARSERPHRVNDAVKTVIEQTGILRGRAPPGGGLDDPGGRRGDPGHRHPAGLGHPPGGPRGARRGRADRGRMHRA